MKNLIIIVALISNAAMAHGTGTEEQTIFPESRLPHETFEQALVKFKQQAGNLQSSTSEDEVLNVAKAIPNVDYSTSNVPVLKNYAELVNTFNQIRDTRFLSEPDVPDFARRISWLYPVNYCYARTALSGLLADQKNLVRPNTIFAFGNLEAQSSFTRSGKVYWYWHVSQILGAKDANGNTSYYVLDPSLDSSKPLPVNEWYKKMGDPNLKAAVCNKNTYSAWDSCYKPEQYSVERFMLDVNMSLKLERQNVVDLGYVDWKNILGDNPPWRLSVFHDKP
jgi:hypothetical protein